MSIRGIPTIHSSASTSAARQASSSTSIPLYGRMRPKHRTTGLCDRGQRRRQRPLARHVREVLERAVRDDGHLRRRDGERLDEPPAPVLGVHDDRVHALVQAPLRGELAAARLARQDVVRGEDDRAPARQQVHVDGLDRQPLEVHDVRRSRGAAVGEHVGHLLGDLGGEAPRGAGRAAAAAIEALDALVPVRRRHGPVAEAARLQSDVRAGAGERGAERVVVGRRVGRGIDDVHAHGTSVLGARAVRLGRPGVADGATIADRGGVPRAYGGAGVGATASRRSIARRARSMGAESWVRTKRALARSMKACSSKISCSTSSEEAMSPSAWA